MEDQLPLTIWELLELHLFLSGLTNVVCAVLFFLGIRKFVSNKRSRITISSVLLVLVEVFSLFFWTNWPFKIDFMLGPVHLPSLIIWLFFSLLIGRYYLKKAIQDN